MILSTFEIIALLVCFIASAFFSGSEAVLLSIGIDRAKQIIDSGGRRASAMIFMSKRPSELLATILVGNNIANVLAASLTTTITARIFKDDAISISVGVTTFIILIFGEIIPKTFARTHAEQLSTFVIRVLQFFYYLTYPVIKTVVWIINNVLGDSAHLQGRIITKDDIEYMISKAEKEKTMDSKQIELINSVLEFPAIKVKDIMLPRSKVKYLNKSMTYEEIIRHAQVDAYTRYPVCVGDLDETVGFLHVKDLAFIQNGERENFKIDKYLKDPFFVYEHMKINMLFEHMNRKKLHLALVKDELGTIVGIITLEDIIEEILGEIIDEHDDPEEDKGETLTEEEGILIPGTMSLRDLYNEFDIKIPLNDNYSTIAGFLLDMLGNNFPEDGQIIVWEGLSFELEKVDEYEIRQVKIKDVDGEKHLFSKKDAVELQDEDTDELDNILADHEA